MSPLLTRRGFLRGTGLVIAAPYIARAATSNALRVVSNPGLENATLNALMDRQGYLGRSGVNAAFIQAPGSTGPFDAITAGAADVCMVSGYNMVLSRIAQGARVRIIGAGMRKAALTIFAPENIRTLADLKGRTVAVGPTGGLLHTLTLQLLRARGIDDSAIRFIDKGSNEQCYEAVLRGEADACCASISHLNNDDHLAAIEEGHLWQALPRYVFQLAYASTDAIRDRQDDLVKLMAAYGALYEYMMSPASRQALFEARRRAQRDHFDEASARAVADFNVSQRPYSKDLTLTESDIAYQQGLVSGPKLPFDAVADMRAAQAAARLPG
ncbi:ABC transporter substrate-binding protein [Pelomonas sp. KK5]|uniref:ABC transporter substrate-binding protein n=1 Tax=Pelomonas sp. KK5 TaxID=1855730 RepID=UPI00097C8B81|nr:ABC transporter substrate-binding protein [Pelomonas sp. KK5]